MSYPMTELQLAILTVLWEREEATVADVHAALLEERRIAQSTVATLLTRMKDRGVVAHRVEGRAYVYRAAVTPEEVRHSVVNEFTGFADRLFSGDVAGLVSTLLATREVDAADLARARKIIEARERALRDEEKGGES